MKLLFTFLALASSLHAANESRNVEVSFYCLKYVPGLETIQVQKAGGYEPVRLSTANLTNPVQTVVIDGEAVFHKTPETEAKDAVWPIIGKAKVPVNIVKAIVVLVPNPPGNAEPYHPLVIDQSGDNFRLGTYRIINFSHRAIRGAIGKSYVEAGSGATSDLELKGEAGAVQGVSFEFADGGRWNRLTETRCAVRRDRRWLVCIYQDPETNRMNMRSIPDRSMLVPVSTSTATN